MKKLVGTVMMTVALAAPSLAAANEIPAGSEIADGLAVHVTPKGIGFLEKQIPYLVPEQVPIADQGGKLFSCLFDSNYWKIKNTLVYLDVKNVKITPIEGALKIHLAVDVAATARVETNGCLFNNGCDVTLPWSPVVADTIVNMGMVADPITNRPKVDATVQQFEIAMALGDPDIDNCFLGEFFEFFLSLFNDMVEDAVVDAIEGQVGPMLEPAIEDAFNSLNLVGELDLDGKKIAYDFYPTALEIHPGTVGIVMGGGFSTSELAGCADPARGSYFTPGTLPLYAELTPVSGQPYDLAMSVADDVLNQLVFSAWRAGLLCRDIDEMGGEPMNTGLLSLIGGSISKIVTPDGPMLVRITAPEPPLVALGGGSTASVSISNLQIDILADVEERLARVMRLQLSPTAGLNVSFSGGQVLASLNFDPANVEATIEYNELAPDANAAVLGLLPTLVETLLPNLTDAIPPIDVPDMAGITVDSAEITPDGPQGDFLSLYAGLGGQVQPGGCNASGTGCGIDTSGGLGCTIGGRGTGNPVVFALLLLGSVGSVAWRRRRA